MTKLPRPCGERVGVRGLILNPRIWKRYINVVANIFRNYMSLTEAQSSQGNAKPFLISPFCKGGPRGILIIVLHLSLTDH